MAKQVWVAHMDLNQLFFSFKLRTDFLTVPESVVKQYSNLLLLLDLKTSGQFPFHLSSIKTQFHPNPDVLIVFQVTRTPNIIPDASIFKLKSCCFNGTQ